MKVAILDVQPSLWMIRIDAIVVFVDLRHLDVRNPVAVGEKLEQSCHLPRCRMVEDE